MPHDDSSPRAAPRGADPGDAPGEAPGEGRAFAFRGGRLLVRTDPSELALPDGREIRDSGLEVHRRHRAEGPGARGDLALDVDPEADAPEGMAFVSLRRLFGGVPDPLFIRAGAAYQTLHWHRRRQHCGRCGAPTRSEGAPTGERHCTECDHTDFLNPTPAVIVLVHRGDEMLLARSARFPEGLYSTLAGFVEPGESLEDALRREVREEVGVELGPPAYFGSQPWPFPNSLMVGFTAPWRAGEIRVDDDEIAAAGWFGPGDVPKVPPRMSIARWMIDRFVEDRGGDPDALESWDL